MTKIWNDGFAMRQLGWGWRVCQKRLKACIVGASDKLERHRVQPALDGGRVLGAAPGRAPSLSYLQMGPCPDSLEPDQPNPGVRWVNPDLERYRTMPEAPMEERRFTDEEVREILKRAVEKVPSRSLVRTEGLYLKELKSIAAEVGIDPGRLEEAARAVALRGGDRPTQLLGAPTVLTLERRVRGEFDPKDTPEILGLIRRIMGQQGEADEIHGSLEWAVKGDIGERYVTLSSRDGMTTIAGSANLTNAATLTYLPAGIIGTITSLVGFIKFAQEGSLVALVVCLVVLPILYPILRTIFRKISDAEAGRLGRVVDGLARLMEGSSE